MKTILRILANSKRVVEYAITKGVKISAYKEVAGEDEAVLNTIEVNETVKNEFTVLAAYTKEGAFLVCKIFKSNQQIYECFDEATFIASVEKINKI